MELPENFSGFVGEELDRYFRNVCIEFKKTLQSSQDSTLLEQEIERFMNASKQMNWHRKSSSVYHKEEGDKAVHKVWTKYQRYIQALQTNTPRANLQDLLDALTEVEQMIHRLKAS